MLRMSFFRHPELAGERFPVLGDGPPEVGSHGARSSKGESSSCTRRHPRAPSRRSFTLLQPISQSACRATEPFHGGFQAILEWNERLPLPLLPPFVPSMRIDLLQAGFLSGLALCIAGNHAPCAQSSCSYAIEFGMNPSFHTWSSRGIVFADAMTRVKDFEVFEGDSIGRATPIAAGLLGEGWPDPATLLPGQECGALLFGQMDGSLPDGRADPYVVTWQGTGEVRLEGLFVKAELERTPKRAVFEVDATILIENTGLSVRWNAPDPEDPVRNIRIWLPGMEGSGRIFWPPYLEKARMMNAGRGPSSCQMSSAMAAEASRQV